MPSFHLSIQVKFYEETKQFYYDLFEATLQDVNSTYCNIEVYGQQLTIHKNENLDMVAYSDIHFGFNLCNEEFDSVYAKAKSKNIQFLLEPKQHISSAGTKRRKMFILDPNGYQIEIKAIN